MENDTGTQDNGTEKTDASGPGFGVVAGVLALLMTVLIARMFE